jgi:Family of unknown function (DUF6492)
MRSVSLFTPAFAGDLERFRILRESIERCGIDLAHVAVIDHEDIPAFRKLRYQKNLTLVSTRDALDPSIEGRRLAWGLRRRDLRRWWLAGTARPIHGWGIQQLIKLAAPRVTQSEIIVCIDCDTFFVGKVTPDDFVAENQLPHLYETSTDVDAEMAEWPARSMRFLGIKATGLPLFRYTHSPVVFSREVLLDLQKFIETRHRVPWMNAVIDAEMIMEYTTYGVFAREVDGLRRVAPVPPSLSTYFWWPDEFSRMRESFAPQVMKVGARIVGIQSKEGAAANVRQLAEPFWRASENPANGAVLPLTGADQEIRRHAGC